jgi:uncharacterized protein (TIGR03382 family)
MQKRWALPLFLGLFGCMSAEDDVGSSVRSLAHEGPWQIPTETVAIGDTQYVSYTGAGPWVGESGCSNGMEPGALALREYILDWFYQVSDVQGFSCRPIRGSSTTMSVHGTGRALDIFIPVNGSPDDGNAADNDLGDPVGNWLIENAEYIGIQYIVWDRWSWGAHRDPGDKSRSYGGTHPHHDHLHIELSLDAAAKKTGFFLEEQGPPDIPRCDPLGPDGGVIDDHEPCTQFFGPSQYWRTELSGYGGGMRWTNAFESNEPSNWVRYIPEFTRAGDYEVEVHIDPEFGRHRETRYAITHADGVAEVIVDQSDVSGWTKLGEFRFTTDQHHDVSIFDNAIGPVDEEQHIVADAIRFTANTEIPGPPPPEDDKPEVSGGCSTSSQPPALPWLFLLGLLACRRRQRRALEK